MMYSRTCYEQPLLWAANFLWEVTLPFLKMAFCIQMNLLWAVICVKRPLFLCCIATARVAAHSRFYCIQILFFPPLYTEHNFLVWKTNGSDRAINPHYGFFAVLLDRNCAYVHWGYFMSNSRSVREAEPSDLRGTLSPKTQHRCTHVLVYTAPGCPRWSPIQFWTGPGVA